MAETTNHKQIFIVKAGLVRDDKLLVLRPTHLKHGRNEDLPGGTLEYGEAPLDALRREVLEETGLTLEWASPVRVWSFVSSRDEFYVGITFACIPHAGEVRLSLEHCEAHWYSEKNLPKTLVDYDEYTAVIQHTRLRQHLHNSL